MDKEVHINFISHSIDDIQSTIRAIDTKAAAIIAILLAPLTELGSIYNHLISVFNKFSGCLNFIGMLLVLVFIVCWAISFFISVRIIGAVDNPSTHIPLTKSCGGIFYSGGIFPTTWKDIFINRIKLSSIRDLDSQIGLLPTDEDAVIRELTFEQMKLVYIREIKIKRLNFCISTCISWLGIGLLIYAISKLF